MKQTKKLKDIILSIINVIVTIVPYGLLGMEVGLMAASLESSNEGQMITCIIMAYIAVMIWYLIHIVIHEAGHLFAGLYSGWTFVSFRVGKTTFMKENGKMVRKKMTIQGTGGQCLMSPPECEPEDCPFTFYLLGGGLLNILIGAISLIIYYVLPWNNMVTLLTFMACGTAGFVTGLSNLFPSKMGGMANDGYNAFIDMPLNPKAKEAQYYLLVLNAQFSSGSSIEEVSPQLIDRIMEFDYEDICSIGIANLYNYKAFIHYAKGEYEELEKCQRRIVETDGVIELFKNEAKCDLLLLAVLQDNEEEIEKLYDKKLQQYIKATDCYPSRKCLMYAYYLLYKKEMKNAEKEWDAMLKATETFPAKTEARAAVAMAESIKDGCCPLLKKDVVIEKKEA